MIWQKILAILIALAGFPLGLFIAHCTKEELKPGRKWFKLILFVCVVIIFFAFMLLKDEILLFILLVIIFIFLFTLASLIAEKKK